MGTKIRVPEQDKTTDISRIVIDVSGPNKIGVSVELTNMDTPIYISDATKAYLGKILAPFFSEAIGAELVAQGFDVTENVLDWDTTGVEIAKTTDKAEVEVDGETVTKEYDVITIRIAK